ncbi:MAG: aminotransferase class V-fold PLP-dependent enzyme, partial [Myxococcota bacterium]
MIYLDHAATSPLLPEVAAAMAEWVGVPANPSSIHGAGRRAAAALDRARDEVARLVERDPAGIVFVSGATEGNHLAIRGVAPRRVAVSGLEHPSVRAAVAATGATVVELSVEPTGVVALPPSLDVDLVALQWVNHELGTVQPVHALRGCAGRAWVHVDAAQAAGRVALGGLDADSVVVSAHKLGGPVGIGAVSLRGGEPFPALFGG